MRYTVEYLDTDDRRICWCVVEWDASNRGFTIARCTTEAEAESFARAYNAIAIYEADPY